MENRDVRKGPSPEENTGIVNTVCLLEIESKEKPIWYKALNQTFSTLISINEGNLMQIITRLNELDILLSELESSLDHNVVLKFTHDQIHRLNDSLMMHESILGNTHLQEKRYPVNGEVERGLNTVIMTLNKCIANQQYN